MGTQNDDKEGNGNYQVPAEKVEQSTASNKDDHVDRIAAEKKDRDSESSHSNAETEDSGNAIESLLNRFNIVVGLNAGISPSEREPILSSFDLEGISAYILSGKARKIVIMCGAGISVNAGIPDFRTPGTGLYSRLQEYNLPHPTAVFEIDYFRRNPLPFFMLAKELYPGRYKPTPTHFFIRLLHDKGLLQRCYTQNIDSLERVAGLPDDKIIAAHGNFDSARCIDCRVHHDVELVKVAIDQQVPARCLRGKKGCRGLVKPDIVFFGEDLPKRFYSSRYRDLESADLLIILGTSLVVQPFASLIELVQDGVPRLLINRERVGEASPDLGWMKGFNFGNGNYRDALFEGDCDQGVWKLCGLLGWEKDLRQLIEGEPIAT